MRLSLIITTYNSPKNLMLVLKSVERQSILPHEVVIADDGSGNETKDTISNYKSNSKINIIHSWQSDNGFRAARSRNKAIIKSTGEYIVLIDGDLILHSEFINDHIQNAEKGHFTQGSRVILTEKKTKEIQKSMKYEFNFFSKGIMNRKNVIHSKILSKIFTIKSKSINGIRSCNLSFYRKDCFNVNGFNNDFVGWGREDSEWWTLCYCW